MCDGILPIPEPRPPLAAPPTHHPCLALPALGGVLPITTPTLSALDALMCGIRWPSFVVAHHTRSWLTTRPKELDGSGLGVKRNSPNTQWSLDSSHHAVLRGQLDPYAC